MKKLVLTAAVGLGAVGALVPLGVAHASGLPAPVPAACVVVNGPNGATVQVGYAPNGPSDCQQLPPSGAPALP